MSSEPTRPQTSGSNSPWRRPEGNAPRSPVHARPMPDLNRPLPPPPTLNDPYDVPALRRKPVAGQPTPSNSQQHTRSFSHPFPSLFGRKTSDKKADARQASKSASNEDDRDLGNKQNNVKNKFALPGNPKATQADLQPLTGKCITCDSTVRWPHGLKVFRCTTCLTINDLEPFFESRPEGLSAGPQSSPAPPRKPVPVSVDRTRAIIEHCLSQFLERQLRRPSEPEPLHDSVLNGRNDVAFPSTFLDDDSPPPSPRPSFKVRSTSDPALTPVRSRRRDLELSLSHDSVEPCDQHDQRRFNFNLNGAETTPRQPQSPRSERSEQRIFAPLESYIADGFVGCAALNASFLTVEPQADTRGAHITQSDQRPPEPQTVTTPNFEPDVFLSELDAKTLLIGDFAENGSWWTGGRANGQEREHRTQRGRSPQRSKSIASARSPRINWPELATWYQMVINAGGMWRRKWQAMSSGLDAEKKAIWDSISQDRLQREVMDSQVHLHRSLLKSTENLLKRPRRPLKHPEDCRFLLMLSFNPLLYTSSPPGLSVSTTSSKKPASTPSRTNTEGVLASPSKRPPARTRSQGSLGHHSGIIKRILGLLANLPNEVHKCLVSWFSRFSDSHFQRIVDLVGSFVTYRLSRQSRKPGHEPLNPTAGLVPSFAEVGSRHASQLHAALGVRSSSTSATPYDGKPKLSVYGEDWQVRVAARVMSLLFQANIGHTSRKRDLPGSLEQRMQSVGLNAKYQAHAHGQMIPISNFYNSMLDYADLVSDFETWETTKTKFTFSQYPFFLSIYAKIHIMEHDARRQMEVKAREAFFDSILSRKAVSQFLVLKVRRDCLVEDSLKSVSEVVGAGAGDIKKGLRIDFVGEEGIDAGGLRKEWFLLLVREIFDPNHGLFVYDEDSQYCYFNPFCFESSEQFFLVGVLLGLAIYNSTILDVAFPPFVFKKMLASAPATGDKLTSTPRIPHGYSLEDLAEFRPALARGLRQLLDFDGDVQETFCRDFIAEQERYGGVVQVPLCPGGAKRAVTNSNRKDFVDLYVHYLLDTAVARQYEPFKRGFFTVCGGNALSLFRPEEIELLVRGSDEPLDIASLRAVATYEGWPKSRASADQPQVVWFWEFFQRVSPIDQRKILSFITGSDRIPAMGATNLNIRVVLLKTKADGFGAFQEPERFPIARTCFNTLSLYAYSTRARLESKLWMAVTGSEGFGLK